MYSNYLIDVGKLVFIVGESEHTTQFKSIFTSSANNKQKIFYKCIQQFPADTFKKLKMPEEKKGIIRKDWFAKILNKNPQMIIMIFNGTNQLQENQVWEDRLKIWIKKINKVYDIMKSNNKQEVRLRIIILISKFTFGGVNLHQKITNFLKTYEKQLNIIQIEYYAKEISKIRNQWVYSLEKNYQNKYKKIQKRLSELFLERKIGGMVKMAIISQMLTKRDQKQKYVQTYKALRYRFIQVIKSVTILTHNQVRQIRAVSDVVFLRYLRCLINDNSPADNLFKATIDHMNYYKLKNLGLNQTHKYFYYEELLWRCTFIENFLQILYRNDLMQNISTLSLCQLLNQLVTYLHALAISEPSLINEQKNLAAKLIEQKQQNYIGLISYKTEELLQTDIIYSFMNDIISHKKDYLSKGIQLIARYKTMNIFKKNQLLFLNIYLLRLYFQDNKFQSFLAIYDEIMRQQMSRSNYFLLNQIFNQIQDEFKSIHQQQKVMFYGVSSMICDYFENYSSLQSHLEHLFISLKQSKSKNPKQITQDLLQEGTLQSLEVKQSQNSTQLNQGYKFNLKKNSSIVAIGCFIKNEFIYIEEQIKLKFDIKLNPVIASLGCKIIFLFNHKNVNRQILIDNKSSSSFQKILIIDPLQYFTKDQSLRIECVKIEVLGGYNLAFVIPNNHISFIKHKQNKIYTKIRCPQIQINNPYNIYYINEVSKFQINIEKIQQFATEAVFSIKQEDPYGKTQVFLDFDQRINMMNSNYYQELVTKDKIINQFWLKCNKIGEKILKLTFHFTVEKVIFKSADLLFSQNQQNSSNGKKYVLKQNFNVTKQIKFAIRQLFQIKKSFYEFSNDDNKILQNKNIPVDKKILTILELSSNQDVQVKEIGQHKNPKKIKYFKEIQKKDFLLKKQSKIKLNMIFQIGSESKDQIELFLMSIYIKWCRTEAKIFSTPYQNLFLDYQTKINCFVNPFSIFFNTTDNFSMKKNQVNKIVLTIKNHSQGKNHVLIQVQGNTSILRVGQKGKSIYIQPFTQKSLYFDILPIARGFLPLPQIKVYIDGIEKNMNIQSGQLIKCI